MERRSVMLRYRFDTLGQLSRHLHAVETGALIFLRDHRNDVHYNRVLLELAVRETSQQSVVRGEVVARADGRIRGAWVRVPDGRVARRLCEPVPFTPRRLARVSADHLVRLRRSTGNELVAQLLDVGAGGLRVRGAGGLELGEWCDVRLIGGAVVTSDLGRAEVVRVSGNEAGLRFTPAGSGVVLRLMASLRQAWERALELDHLPECCAEGTPVEPSLPNLRAAAIAQVG